MWKTHQLLKQAPIQLFGAAHKDESEVAEAGDNDAFENAALDLADKLTNKVSYSTTSGSISMSSMGSMEPINFQKDVIEPINF